MPRLQTTRPGATAGSARSPSGRAETKTRAQRPGSPRSNSTARQTPGPRQRPRVRDQCVQRVRVREATRPSPSPATRNSQPIRFSGRLEARTKPVIGTATFTTCPETSETVQLVRLAGTRCRFTYASTSPAPISATDPAALHPATHRAVRALIRIPHPPIKTVGLGAGCTSPTNRTLRPHRSGNVTARRETSTWSQIN